MKICEHNKPTDECSWCKSYESNKDLIRKDLLLDDTKEKGKDSKDTNTK